MQIYGLQMRTYCLKQLKSTRPVVKVPVVEPGWHVLDSCSEEINDKIDCDQRESYGWARGDVKSRRTQL